ncbi:MAG: efflux RND transporter permease subunit [Acidobacteria bacterium]|nr:efflux RND transporter permease subunit [Acidobacteriota bacterium]
MRRLIAHLIGRPMEAGLGILIVVLLGLYGLGHMSVDLFPNLNVPVVQVIVHAPGAAPEDLELSVTRPVEQALKGAPGIRRVASTTMQGVVIITVQFAWGTEVRDARQIVLGRLGQVRSKLPAGVIPRLEHIGTTLEEVGGWAIWGAGDPVEVSAIVRRDLVARLMTVPGVSLVDVIGGQRRAFWADLDPARMAELHLTIGEVERAIRRTHGANVAGFIERGDEDVVIRADSRILTPAELAAVPIRLPRGEMITLGQVAHVHEGRAPKHSEVRADGVPALAVFVRKQPGASTITVERAVEAELHRARSLLPPGVRIEKFYDQSEVLVQARRAIINDLVAGAALAVLVLWFFLGSPRPTLAVALTIPLSLLATVAVLWLAGQSLNVITMAALTLAVGMIVDDAIVVTENVFRHQEGGKSPAEAAAVGAAEIAAADASGTFTTVTAFLPLIMIGGLAAVFVRPFGLTVSAALLASLVLSLTTVPVMLARGRGATVAHNAPAQRMLRVLGQRLDGALGHIMRHRAVTLGLAVILGVAMLASGVLRHGPVTLLPPVDEGALLVEYVLPPGVSLRESLRIGQELGRRASKLPGVKLVEERVGAPEGGASVEGINRGELRIKLAPLESGRPSADELLRRLDRASADIPGVILMLHQPTQERMDEAFSGLPAVFGVTIFGASLATLERVSIRVEKILDADPAVHNIVNNSRFHRPQLDIRIDTRRCAALGVDPADARKAVAAATWGDEVLRVLKEREQVPILIRVEGFGQGLEKIGTLPVTTASGAAVPLARIATLTLHRVPAKIERLNGQRQLTILAEVDGNLVAVAHRLNRRFAALDLPPGVSVTCTGQYQVLMKTARELLFVLLAAGLLILAIMTLEFGALRQAAWILAIVPFSLAGGAFGVAVTGAGLNVAVAMGALTLLGIGVNNGIVLVDFANRRIAAGAGSAEALREAAQIRLRPILATSLTTIAGLLPTALGIGAGQHVFQAFAVTVIFGLTAGTAATLLILPAAVVRSR